MSRVLEEKTTEGRNWVNIKKGKKKDYVSEIAP